MRNAVVIFTRDLRVHDHVALAGALRQAEYVVPAFVFDEAILGARFNRPNRTAFLVESLANLDASASPTRSESSGTALQLIQYQPGRIGGRLAGTGTGPGTR